MHAEWGIGVQFQHHFWNVLSSPEEVPSPKSKRSIKINNFDHSSDLLTESESHLSQCLVHSIATLSECVAIADLK